MKTQKRPSLKTLERLGQWPPGVETLKQWMDDGVAEATDGCQVEPDGTCPHGTPSWLLQLGLI